MLKQIGLYGGSFDPVHKGHLQVATQAIKVLGLDRFFFIPASQAPHKKDLKQAGIQQRLEMLRCAIKEIDKVDISMCEIERGGVSYTIDTIRHFCSEFPDAKLYFLMGSDSLHHFDSWFQVDEIMRLCCVTILSRKGYNSPSHLVDLMNLDNSKKKKLLQQFIDISIDEISSTEIRDAIQKKAPIDSMVPPCVNKYIVDNSVYDR